MKGGWFRRAAIAALGGAVLLLSWWVRHPSIPYGGGTPRASGISPDSGVVSETESRRAHALDALANAVASEHRRLAAIAAASVNAPQDPERAFDYLKERASGRESGVILADAGGPLAWAGQFRNDPVITETGTSLLVSPFYVSLQVVETRGGRAAIASSLLHAEPPADRIANGLDDRIPERNLVTAFRFASLSDTSADRIIDGGDGRPLLRVDAIPMPEEMIRFGRTASARGWGAIVVSIGLIILITIGWKDRSALATRLLTLAIAIAAIALVPWNNFSNFARAFDPAYFYSPIIGPLTASAGPFMMFSAILLFAVIALIRARLEGVPRIVAGITAIALLSGGFTLVEHIARGIVLPPWGATASLWIAWEAPLFTFLFAIYLAAASLGRITLGQRSMIDLRTASAIAVVCASIATFVVWTKTTEQRLQLAMRDVAGLERADSDAMQLLTRFGSQLESYDSAGTRADLLERYAASDLASAGLQVSLGSFTPAGEQRMRLDLAQLTYDSAELASVVKEAVSRGAAVVRATLGPTARQSMLAVPHRAGGITTVVASPHTRLVAVNPYTALLGFEQPDKTEPPYTLTLADVTPGGGAKAGAMTWRRVANEWHGDQIIDTSNGPSRAHVEIDLRSWPTRLVRVVLIVILDIAIAGILWALATVSEGGFVRWIRGRSSRWLRSYRGRLTLALFAFFVVPAVGFGIWSYQRLQRDDRGVRELLVREVLGAAATGASPSEIAREGVAGAPLFVFSNGVLASSSDSLYEMLAPTGRMIPRRVHVNIALHGELSATSREIVAGSTMYWGYRAVSSSEPENVVVSAPARSDELVLDRRRRDLTLLVLFATAVGGIAAFWLSGFAARILARDLELARLEVRRAERVIAWGEMARQVAHEIKNPLTPIRLGVQHLKRARTDQRVDFDRVLDDNISRILSEIDRLDKIAQTFTRYGTAPEELPPAEDIDVAAILRDVIALEKMGIGGVEWVLSGADTQVIALARKDELRDVLLNVFENARLARARHVRVGLATTHVNAQIHIDDDGLGVAPDKLPRVFEPHFSTRTTGSGLGLAISRRLIESWGGTIELESEEGKGAHVTISLPLPAA